MMKHAGTLAWLIIGVFIMSAIFVADISYFNSIPPVVKYDIPIPLWSNCTSFNYDVRWDWLSVSPNTYGIRDPNEHYSVKECGDKSFTGTARVGTEIQIIMTYYGNTSSPVSMGLNAVSKPSETLLGTQTYNVLIQETNDNVVGQYDFGFVVWIIVMVVIGIIFITCAGASYRWECQGE